MLSSSHACAKNVRTPPGTLHICYCHTPMRYAWEEGFLEGEEVGAGPRLALPPLLRRLRRQDLAGASGPDVFVANSRHVAERIARYYGRSAEVVHPPDRRRSLPRDRALAGRTSTWCSGALFPTSASTSLWPPAIALGAPLKVAGAGRGLDAIRASAGAGIELLGKVTDSERDELLAGARALLFPGEEDFGIVPVETQAAGAPVIAYGVGGAWSRCSTGAPGCSSTSRARPLWPARSSASRGSRSMSRRCARTPGASARSAFAGSLRR